MTLPDYARAFQEGGSVPPDILTPPDPLAPVVTAISPSSYWTNEEGSGGQLIHLALTGINIDPGAYITMFMRGTMWNWMAATVVGNVASVDWWTPQSGSGVMPDHFGLSNGDPGAAGAHLSNLLPCTPIIPANGPPHATLTSIAPATAPISGGPVVVTLTGANFDVTRPLYVLVGPSNDTFLNNQGFQVPVTVIDATHCEVTLVPPATAVPSYIRMPHPPGPCQPYHTFTWT